MRGGLRLASIGTLAVMAVAALFAAQVGPARTRAVQAAAAGGRYHALVSPIRLLDTRNGTGRPAGPIPAGTTFDLAVSGGPVPATDLQAVVLSVTVTESSDLGFLTVWPSGTPLPLTSNLNWWPSQQVANLVTVGVAANGLVSFYVNRSQSHVIADIHGYYSTAAGAGGEFRPLMPARILDTRVGLGAPAARLGAGSVLRLQVGGRGNVPGSGVSAVVLQLTAAGPSANSYLAAYPSGQPFPGVSSVIFPASRNASGRLVVGLSAGKVDIYQSQGETDVVADVSGYFTDSTIADGGGLFVPLQPARVLDTRNGTGYSGQLGPGTSVTVPVSAGGSVPAGAAAAVLNLTLVDPTEATYLTAYPAGSARTLSSDVNASPGSPVTNLGVVKLSPDGRIKLFNSAGRAHVLADLVGYLGAAPTLGSLPSAPQSLAAAPSDRSAGLTWAAPADSGGSQVVSWAIQVVGGAETVAAGDALSATLTGLTNKVGYSFQVVALNAAGSGAASNLASATPVGTADPPVGLSATPGSGTITLNWGPPPNDGGFPIDHYRVTVWPGGQLVGAPATSVTITNLSHHVPYTFTVQTVNTYGVGPGTGVGPIIPYSLRRIVISLGQQALSAYEGGYLVLQTLITTGRPELPTPPGSYQIMNKQSPFHFISPWGPQSPFWYQDAWVRYAMLFIPGGYFLHDAPWRGWFGPGSQYGDGTHGCVNIPLDPMGFIFGWAQVGDQVDVIG